MGQNALYLLLVEDSEADSELVLAELRRGGYEPIFIRVESPEGFRSALDQCAWDLILSDGRTRRFDALEALNLIRERGLDVPFIFVTGPIAEATDVGLAKAGAHDFVRKDRLANLVPAVRRELEKRRRLQEERHRLS